MGGYNFLTRITDANIRNAIKALTDRVNTLETQAASIGTLTGPLTANLDAGSHKLTAVANPTADADAVNLITLKRYVEARLSAAGLIDASGHAVTPADTDNGQTAAGVAAAGPDGHPSVSGPSAYNAGLIIGGVAHEFPALVAPAVDEATFDTNRLELLERTIWHLIAFGFTAGRQQNPSGILSTDKIAVVEDGILRAFDCYTGTFPTGITVQALQVFPPNLVADAGTPD
jgi:hypothetical protein